jgi:hypothetical protein
MLAVFPIGVSRRNLPVIHDHVVNCSLVVSEGVNVLLAELLTGLGQRTLDDIRGNFPL